MKRQERLCRAAVLEGCSESDTTERMNPTAEKAVSCGLSPSAIEPEQGTLGFLSSREMALRKESSHTFIWMSLKQEAGLCG